MGVLWDWLRRSKHLWESDARNRVQCWELGHFLEDGGNRGILPSLLVKSSRWGRSHHPAERRLVIFCHTKKKHNKNLSILFGLQQVPLTFASDRWFFPATWSIIFGLEWASIHYNISEICQILEDDTVAHPSGTECTESVNFLGLEVFLAPPTAWAARNQPRTQKIEGHSICNPCSEIVLHFLLSYVMRAHFLYSPGKRENGFLVWFGCLVLSHYIICSLLSVSLDFVQK